jgi:hypothetical protein
MSTSPIPPGTSSLGIPTKTLLPPGNPYSSSSAASSSTSLYPPNSLYGSSSAASSTSSLYPPGSPYSSPSAASSTTSVLSATSVYSTKTINSIELNKKLNEKISALEKRQQDAAIRVKKLNGKISGLEKNKEIDEGKRQFLSNKYANQLAIALAEQNEAEEAIENAKLTAQIARQADRDGPKVFFKLMTALADAWKMGISRSGIKTKIRLHEDGTIDPSVQSLEELITACNTAESLGFTLKTHAKARLLQDSTGLAFVDTIMAATGKEISPTGTEKLRTKIEWDKSSFDPIAQRSPLVIRGENLPQLEEPRNNFLIALKGDGTQAHIMSAYRVPVSSKDNSIVLGSTLSEVQKKFSLPEKWWQLSAETLHDLLSKSEHFKLLK